MVAVKKDDGNAGSIKLPDTVDEKQAGVVIRPITVIEVAGQDDEIDALGQCELNQACECFPCSPAQRLNGSALVFIEPAQWTIQVNISGMQEPHGHHSVQGDMTCSALLCEQ